MKEDAWWCYENGWMESGKCAFLCAKNTKEPTGKETRD